ncbi:MAG: RNA methyltransferase [Planctomycetota bacterium]|nr:MAG: RNA methyltransferase [Planctomycetota bacterium]
MAGVFECIDVEANDPRLDAFREVRDRDLRGSLRLHAIESERVVRRYLAAALRRRAHPMPPILEPNMLLATPDALSRLADVLTATVGDPCAHDPCDGDQGAAFPALTVFRCADEQALHSITGYTMHSGAIALGRRADDGSIDELSAYLAKENVGGARPVRDVLVALDAITQTDNIGAIFRNAASFGARAVVLSPRASDPFLRKAMRVSMGRAVNLPWARARGDEWPACLDRLRREHGYMIIAAEDTTNAVDLATFKPPARSIVVFGAEENGVSPAVLGLADAVVKIPMSKLGSALANDPPSLNVSIASAVVLHHILA